MLGAPAHDHAGAGQRGPVNRMVDTPVVSALPITRNSIVRELIARAAPLRQIGRFRLIVSFLIYVRLLQNVRLR